MSDIGIRNYDDLFLHRDFKLKDLKSISDIQHDLNYINLNDHNSPNSPNSHSWVDILIGKKSNKSLDDNILLSPTSDRLRGAFRGIDKKLTSCIPHYNNRYIIRPGLSGWAQVNYPYGASIDDSKKKLSFDLYYLKNFSIWFDFLILFKTIRLVLLKKGSEPI